MKAMVIRCNGNVNVLDAPEQITCAWAANKIGCEWVEIVRPRKLKRGFIMLADEEGLLKRNYINIVGSWLYGTEEHGSPIAGDIMVIREVNGPEGPEFCGMSDQDVEEMKKELCWTTDQIREYARKIRAAM